MRKDGDSGGVVCHNDDGILISVNGHKTCNLQLAFMSGSQRKWHFLSQAHDNSLLCCTNLYRGS